MVAPTECTENSMFCCRIGVDLSVKIQSACFCKAENLYSVSHKFFEADAY